MNKHEHNYIERYVYDVTRRIETKQREEVSKELTSQIYDMLPERPTNKEIEDVLLSLGTPRDMASKYRSNEKNYLISPKYYQDYITTLKIVGSIFVSFTLVLSILSFAFALNTIGVEAAIDLFADEIGTSVIQSLLSSFAIVTIIYVILERYNVNLDKNKKPFTLDNLPEIPKHESLQINRFGRIFALAFMVSFAILFVFLILNHSQYLGYFAKEGEIYIFTPLFNDNIKYMVIPIIVMSALEALKYIYQITTGVKTKLTLIFSTVTDVLDCLILLIFLTTKAFISVAFFEKMAEVFSVSIGDVMNAYDLYLNITYGTVAFIAIIVLADGLYKYYQFNKVTQLSGK